MKTKLKKTRQKLNKERKLLKYLRENGKPEPIKKKNK